MNTFNNIYKRIVKGKGMLCLSLLASGLSLASCSDYLEILPLNEVVLENFWTKKDDVTSVLNSCYESLGEEKSLERIGVWGEMRSENIVSGQNVPNHYNEILKENILPTNEIVDWSSMYRTINRCNTVIHYAPGVAELDPNYTHDQMLANVAEATFIRDLAYFYLIRAFRDVPMSFEPSIDDTKEYAVAATPMMDALKMLSEDLEKVKDNAVRRYVDDSKMTTREMAVSARENCSKVTRVAIYALLADIYLWRGEYDKCIQCCDYVIDFKKNQYAEKVANIGELTDIYLFKGIPMIRESLLNSKYCGNAYSEIFGTGFSFESIFELGYLQNSTENKYVSNCYINGSGTFGRFGVPEDYYQNVASGSNDYFAKNDCRVYENIYEGNGKFWIMKYGATEYAFETENITSSGPRISYDYRSSNNANWIFYRLSDVMLIKSEALIMKGESEFQKAFTLINTINKRARNYTENVKSDTLVFSAYSSSKEEMEKLLMLERKREFMFEGKRWFDLVRKSLRDGNTRYLSTEATQKQKENAVAIKIQLADPNAMFWPYHREELKKNNLLKQNSAYSDSEQFQK